MVFQYASDLHLGHRANREFISDKPLRPVADTLLLAGDIIPLHSIDRFKDFFKYLSDHWEKVVWIPGNHEYYGSDITRYTKGFKEQIRANIILCDQHVIKIDDVHIIAATLWSHIAQENEQSIQSQLNDFNYIKLNGKRLSIDDFNQLHLEHSSFFLKQLETLGKNGNKVIALCHHVPTLIDYPLKYVGSDLNNAFVSDFADRLNAPLPSYWIYGHHHVNVPSFEINGCHFLTNQLGYVQAREHSKFNHSTTITV